MVGNFVQIQSKQKIQNKMKKTMKPLLFILVFVGLAGCFSKQNNSVPDPNVNPGDSKKTPTSSGENGGAVVVSNGSRFFLGSEAGELLLNGSEIDLPAPDLSVGRYFEYDFREVIDIRVKGTKEIRIEMTSPRKELFAAKAYDFVRVGRSEFPRHAGIAITIGHSTVSSISARIQIHEIKRDEQGKIINLAADFMIAEREYNRHYLLKGAVRFKSTFPVENPIEINAVVDPMNRAHSEISVADGLGGMHRTTQLDANFFIENYGPWSPSGLKHEYLKIRLARNFATGKDGHFELTTRENQVVAVGGTDRMSYGLTDFGQCMGRIQNLEILEIERDVDMKIQKFAANFEVDCSYSDAVSRGFIRYHSDLPIHIPIIH